MVKRTIGILVIVVAVGCVVLSGTAQTIVGTRHDLSSSGSGPWQSDPSTDPMDRICVFCHTPHSASPEVPLWNHNLPVNPQNPEPFVPYTSSTFQGTYEWEDNRPVGVSLLCLGCHDGVTAINSLRNNPEIQMLGGFDQLGDVYYPGTPYHDGMGPNVGESYPSGGTNVYVNDLSNDHPVSFRYDTQLAIIDGNLVDPIDEQGSGLPGVDLFEGRLECSSCHNVHSDLHSPFLVMSNSGSALCLACHEL